jgi:Arc/MetJ family transcription regulator
MSDAPAPDSGCSDLSAHSSAADLAFTHVVAELREILGTRLVAYIAGVESCRAVDCWANGSQTPSEQIQERLRLTRCIAVPIANADSAQIAQSWFQGLNPELDDRVPARVLRDGDLKDVERAIEAAVQAFLVGG